VGLGFVHNKLLVEENSLGLLEDCGGADLLFTLDYEVELGVTLEALNLELGEVEDYEKCVE